MPRSTLDDLDRGVTGALLAHPRASVAQVGRAVGGSEATVSRRMSRLLRSGLVRVAGVLDMEASRRARSVFVRLRCRPGSGRAAAYQLAEWDEAGSVKILTGNVDCMAELAYTSNEHLMRLMMEELPHLDGVVATSSTQVIRRFSTPHSWEPGLLPDATAGLLRAERLDHWDERAYPEEPAPIGTLDERLLELLARDGRMGWQEMADECGVMPVTARRHVESMMARGVVRMRTVVEPAVIGLPVGAFVWLSISPTQLGLAGRILAGRPEVLMISATTGDRNLCGEIAVASDGRSTTFSPTRSGTCRVCCTPRSPPSCVRSSGHCGSGRSESSGEPPCVTERVRKVACPVRRRLCTPVQTSHRPPFVMPGKDHVLRRLPLFPEDQRCVRGPSAAEPSLRSDLPGEPGHPRGGSRPRPGLA